MDFAYTEEDEAFRAELRGWLDANLGDFLKAGEIEDRQANISRTMARRRAWQRRLNEGRWAAINWPREWGGREATIMQNVIYSEEMAKARTPGYRPNIAWVRRDRAGSSPWARSATSGWARRACRSACAPTSTP